MVQSAEDRRAAQLKYQATPAWSKSIRKSNWKKRGLIHPNLDELYDHYINTHNCEHCNIQLTVDRHKTPTTRCLDHCHESGEFRNILCFSCNVKRGQNRF